MDKRDINHAHFRKRLAQRYGVVLPFNAIEFLAASCEDQDARALFVRKKTQRRSLYLLTVRGVVVPVIFSTKVGEVSLVTALPDGAFEREGTGVTPQRYWSKLRSINPRRDLQQVLANDRLLAVLERCATNPIAAYQFSKKEVKAIRILIEKGYIKPRTIKKNRLLETHVPTRSGLNALKLSRYRFGSTTDLGYG